MDRRQRVGYGVSCVALAVIGLTIFLRWPTTFTPLLVDWSLNPWLEFLQATDSTGNACLSLHVAFAVYAALWFGRMLRSLGGGRGAKLLNALWAALIAHSTLGTHQHVAVDSVKATDQSKAPEGFTIYEITPRAPLAIGEYAVVVYSGEMTALVGTWFTGTGNAYFDFGVDN